MWCDLHVQVELCALAAILRGLAVPVVTLGNYLVGRLVVRSWVSHYRLLGADRGLAVASNPVVEAA